MCKNNRCCKLILTLASLLVIFFSPQIANAQFTMPAYLFGSAGVQPDDVKTPTGGCYNTGHCKNFNGDLIQCWQYTCEYNSGLGYNVCGAEPQPLMVSCDDGSECTMNDTCDGAGNCDSGTPRDCSDDNDCTVNFCDPSIGCMTLPTSNFCANDGSYCDGITEVSCPISTDPCKNFKGTCNEYLNACFNLSAPDGTECGDDGNQCTLNVCSGGECHQPLANGSPCNDLDACTTESCQDGECVGNPINCDDGLACTVDSCESERGVGGCQHDMLRGYCLIDGVCYNSGDKKDGNPCQSCNPDISLTEWTSATAGTTCDDGDLCTDSTCQLIPYDSYVMTGYYMGCVSTPKNCSDAGDGICTDGVCDPNTGNCVADPRPDGTACDDGLFCVVSESCQAGSCVGSEVGVEPLNECQNKVCDETGNKFDIITASNSCFIDGNCVNAGELNPANQCQECNPSKSQSKWSDKSSGTVCDDGEFCTENDICVSVQGDTHAYMDCQGQPKDDEVKKIGGGQCGYDLTRTCTDGAWSEWTGEAPSLKEEQNCGDEVCGGSQIRTCTEDGAWSDWSPCGRFQDSTTACNDGNPCTENDRCDGSGSCLAGSEKNCSDLSSACLEGVCNSTTGACEAQPANEGNECKDGKNCTTNDVCSNGECAGIPVQSNPLSECAEEVCKESTGDMELVIDSGKCFIGGSCFGPGMPNPDNNCQVCNPYKNKTEWTDKPIDSMCSDGNKCTVDSCQNVGDEIGCVGEEKNCSDAGDGICTDGVCDSNTGNCIAEPRENGTSCDDELFCTAQDSCQAGLCTGVEIVKEPLNECQNKVCDEDGNTYFTETAPNSCFIDGNCINAGELNPANQCQECNPGKSQSKWSDRTSGSSCDDGDFCTENDICVSIQGDTHAYMGCQGQPKDDEVKTVGEGPCEYTLTSSCADGAFGEFTGEVPSTKDERDCGDEVCGGSQIRTCTEEGVWGDWTPCGRFQQASVVCDDGNLCTENDHCDGSGSCIAGNEKSCDDNNLCTEDTCDATAGCQYSDVEIPANDAQCQKNICLPSEGIVPQPDQGASCDDGDLCTGEGVCDAKGLCVAQALEGIGDVCSVGVGACKDTGKMSCENGIVSCSAEEGAAGTELCGNNIDDNCNGEVDEGFDVGKVCEEGVGECLATGKMVCTSDGSGTECSAEAKPAGTEICDAEKKDEDCDGESNEGCLCVDGEERVCTDGINECSVGKELCKSGNWGDCIAEADPAKEGQLCEEDSNICTGVSRCSAGSCQVVDEPLVCDDSNLCTDDSCDPIAGCQHAEIEIPANDAQCQKNICLPSEGIVAQPDQGASCDDGDLCTGEGVCDAKGLCVAEALEGIGDVCEVGVGACKDTGKMSCENGIVSCSAEEGAAGTELCGNNIDDNCNGEVDEGFDVGKVCEEGVGECLATGKMVCTSDGSGTECSAEAKPAGTEICDAEKKDEDCDGESNEGCLCVDGEERVCTDGINECSVGKELCKSGNWGDCIAEADPAKEGQLCEEDSNICTGVSRCSAGSCQVVDEPLVCDDSNLCTDDSCDPIAGCQHAEIEIPANDAQCQKNICLPSEGIVAQPDQGASCDDGDLCTGEGVCDAKGLCVAEALEGIGDVCEVGVGACKDTGKMSCENGIVSCSAEEGAAGTELCGNNIDDNCNGEVDEGFEALGEECSDGVGVCQDTGAMVCSEDKLSLECSANAGEAGVESCTNMGADDDCDGELDNIAGLGDECTNGLLGECLDEGVKECIDGELKCNAEIIEPGEELCLDDNKDEDCDGESNEEDVCDCINGIVQDCFKYGEGLDQALGICAEGGYKTCENGKWGECDAPEPALEVCDNLDNDCDGEVDEEVRNDCGGCSDLVAGLGDECSSDEICGTGSYQCDGEDALKCIGKVKNPCGGCGELDGVPDQECFDECHKGVWTCEGERVLCSNKAPLEGLGKSCEGNPCKVNVCEDDKNLVCKTDDDLLEAAELEDAAECVAKCSSEAFDCAKTRAVSTKQSEVYSSTNRYDNEVVALGDKGISIIDIEKPDDGAKLFLMDDHSVNSINRFKMSKNAPSVIGFGEKEIFMISTGDGVATPQKIALKRDGKDVHIDSIVGSAVADIDADGVDEVVMYMKVVVAESEKINVDEEAEPEDDLGEADSEAEPPVDEQPMKMVYDGLDAEAPANAFVQGADNPGQGLGQGTGQGQGQGIDQVSNLEVRDVIAIAKMDIEKGLVMDLTMIDIDELAGIGEVVIDIASSDNILIFRQKSEEEAVAAFMDCKHVDEGWTCDLGEADHIPLVAMHKSFILDAADSSVNVPEGAKAAGVDSGLHLGQAKQIDMWVGASAIVKAGIVVDTVDQAIGPKWNVEAVKINNDDEKLLMPSERSKLSLGLFEPFIKKNEDKKIFEYDRYGNVLYSETGNSVRMMRILPDLEVESISKDKEDLRPESAIDQDKLSGLFSKPKLPTVVNEIVDPNGPDVVLFYDNIKPDDEKDVAAFIFYSRNEAPFVMLRPVQEGDKVEASLNVKTDFSMNVPVPTGEEKSASESVTVSPFTYKAVYRDPAGADSELEFSAETPDGVDVSDELTVEGDVVTVNWDNIPGEEVVLRAEASDALGLKGSDEIKLSFLRPVEEPAEGEDPAIIGPTLLPGQQIGIAGGSCSLIKSEGRMPLINIFIIIIMSGLLWWIGRWWLISRKECRVKIKKEEVRDKK